LIWWEIRIKVYFLLLFEILAVNISKGGEAIELKKNTDFQKAC
jgi:hypothetical protein